MTDAPDLPKLTLARRYLGVLLLPILVVSVSEAMLAAFADTDVDWAGLILIDAPELTELVGRYRYLSVFFFYAAITVTIPAIFAAELVARHTWSSMGRLGLGLLGLVLFSFLFSLLEPAWMGSFESYELLGADLFKTALAGGDLPYCGVDRCDGTGAFSLMGLLMTMTNVLSAIAVSAVILGMLAALSRSGTADLTTPVGIRAEALHLQAAQKTVRRYLYLAGVLLSVGMMLGLGWMSWPAGLIADGTQAGQYRELVSSISLFRGTSYTVLILSFYMPISLIQMVRIERFHDAANASGMEEISAEVQGFDIERIGSLEAFKAILSILSPIIAGGLGSFVGLDVLG